MMRERILLHLLAMLDSRARGLLVDKVFGGVFVSSPNECFDRCQIGAAIPLPDQQYDVIVAPAFDAMKPEHRKWANALRSHVRDPSGIWVEVA
jgi:hypothetical protein